MGVLWSVLMHHWRLLVHPWRLLMHPVLYIDASYDAHFPIVWCVVTHVASSSANTQVVCRPAATYAPWFATVLKTCRVAVKVIHMLVGEVSTRAHRQEFLPWYRHPTSVTQAD